MPVSIEGINKDCPQCKGTGFFWYDEHHGTICDLCCPHDMGYSILKGDCWGKREGMEVCKRGCGTLRAGRKEREIQKQREEALKSSNNTQADAKIIEQGLFIVKCRYCNDDCIIASFDADYACNSVDCHRARLRIEQVGVMR